jgi:hypothetical protein
MLNDEERKKIYEEEKARLEAQVELTRKAPSQNAAVASVATSVDVAKKGSGLGVASLVLGILALFPFSILTGIPAIIIGHASVNQKRRGKGMAIAGLIMGWVSLVPVVIVAAVMLTKKPESAGGPTPKSLFSSESRKTPSGPKTSDFEILNWRTVQPEYGAPHVVGEVRNNGSYPAGVHLQAIMRAANGDVVGSEDFWPASISNIPPGGTWPISYPLESQGEYSKVELRIVGVDVW